jgi:hypothetical protein
MSSSISQSVVGSDPPANVSAPSNIGAPGITYRFERPIPTLIFSKFISGSGSGLSKTVLSPFGYISEFPVELIMTGKGWLGLTHAICHANSIESVVASLRAEGETAVEGAINNRGRNRFSPVNAVIVTYSRSVGNSEVGPGDELGPSIEFPDSLQPTPRR